MLEYTKLGITMAVVAIKSLFVRASYISLFEQSLKCLFYGLSVHPPYTFLPNI